MTKEKLCQMQAEISKEIIKVVSREHVLGRQTRLAELNLMLDSLNRAAHYLLKDGAVGPVPIKHHQV